MRIEDMTMEQLLAMNTIICQRIKELRDRKTLQALIQLRVGMTVVVDVPDEVLFGVITKINRKTATVLADDGTYYRVSPSLLRPIHDVE